MSGIAQDHKNIDSFIKQVTLKINYVIFSIALTFNRAGATCSESWRSALGCFVSRRWKCLSRIIDARIGYIIETRIQGNFAAIPCECRQREVPITTKYLRLKNRAHSTPPLPSSPKDEDEEGKHNKYCHFCQHVKLRSSAMLACSNRGCSRRFCEHCLVTQAPPPILAHAAFSKPSCSFQ